MITDAQRALLIMIVCDSLVLDGKAIGQVKAVVDLSIYDAFYHEARSLIRLGLMRFVDDDKKGRGFVGTLKGLYMVKYWDLAQNKLKMEL